MCGIVASAAGRFLFMLVERFRRFYCIHRFTFCAAQVYFLFAYWKQRYKKYGKPFTYGIFCKIIAVARWAPHRQCIFLFGIAGKAPYKYHTILQCYRYLYTHKKTAIILQARYYQKKEFFQHSVFIYTSSHEICCVEGL
jgi:hypothetical protein